MSMDFLTYCKLNDILIDHLPPLGVWRRYPTVDHPHKRNGAVKYMGDHGFVQNWATNLEVEVWKSDKPNSFDRAKLMRDVQAAEDKKRRQQREAAGKAAMLASSRSTVARETRPDATATTRPAMMPPTVMAPSDRPANR